jgi:glycosyltransferase involved in cell wall biosynthesis
MRIAILTSDNRESFKAYDEPDPQMGMAPEALLQGFAALNEVEVHVISCLQQAVSKPEQSIGNITYHALHVPKMGWLRTGYQGCIRAVRKKLREIRPDIVHGQGTERDCALSAIFSGFPNVITIHGNMRAIAQINQVARFSYHWLAAQLEGFVLPRTDGVVCITNYTREAVKSLANRVWVLPNAVDRNFFEIKSSPDPTEPPIGLCVGTVCFHKNQNGLIKALDTLAQQKRFRIVFLGQAGNGAYGHEFLQLVKERDWCEFAGWAGREQLKHYLQKASFLVLPTREDNCPMVVLEAMAAGVPVLASKIGGVPDLIDSEITGLFGDPERPESFEDGISRLLDDRQFSGRLAGAAKVHAQQNFHPEIVAKGHVRIYREVLQNISAGKK